MSHANPAYVPHLRGFFRVVERPGLSPTVIGPLVAAAYVAVVIPFFNLAGLFDGVRVGDVPFWLHDHARIELWYAVFLGFLAFAVGHVFRGCAGDLEKLRPVLRLDRSFEALRDESLSIDRRRFWIAGGIGVVIGLVMSVSALVAIPLDLRPEPWEWFAPYLFVREIFSDVVALQALVLSFDLARGFSRLGSKNAVVDLLDLRSLDPFSNVGLRFALVWLVANALILWAVVDTRELLGPLGPAMVAVWVFAGPGLSGAALILPVWGVRRAIQREKRAELVRVRGAIAHERDGALAGGDGATTAAARLPGLLQYEERIRRVREWPFDMPDVLRYLLYLGIPIASWVAAAFVERWIDLALN